MSVVILLQLDHAYYSIRIEYASCLMLGVTAFGLRLRVSVHDFP